MKAVFTNHGIFLLEPRICVNRRVLQSFTNRLEVAFAQQSLQGGSCFAVGKGSRGAASAKAKEGGGALRRFTVDNRGWHGQRMNWDGSCKVSGDDGCEVALAKQLGIMNEPNAVLFRSW